MARFTLLTLALTLTAAAQAPKNDDADPLSWLCKPGRQDACAVDLTTTSSQPTARPPSKSGR